MAYSDDVGLVDEFNGLDDLKNKIVRAVGNPYERFEEDALRLLRAVRFSAKLGFEIESKTVEAIKKLSNGLSKVSKERVEVELSKTITSSNPIYVKKVFEFGLAKYICDGFDDIKIGRFEPNLSTHMAYACLLYNTKVEKANNILRSLKLDNNNINKVKLLLLAKDLYDRIKHSNNTLEYIMGIKELIGLLTYELVYDFIRLIYINENDKILVKKIESYIKECEKSRCPIFIKDLAINGNDIMNIGFDGVEVGIVLRNIQKIVYKNREYNNKEKLMSLIKEVYINYKGGAV
jgi:tRNA nucleotidyltransferase (CCA-adding enzyme)